ncbi:hypothetical protein Goari_000938 [Gossypium aridum]|uniref:Uncharacterized protein n=1 Tax=Gossypium aridum TaxID=34290 RepID=A0A7J8YJV0_GOSAI|nr:hypothetical protein [Gossypium aridum]
MEALHKLDLWRKTDENWRDYHKEYIDIWDHRMKFLPIREPFFSSNIATYLEFRGGAAIGSSPAPTQQRHRCLCHIAVNSFHLFLFILPTPCFFTSTTLYTSTAPYIYTSNANFDTNVDTCTDTDGDIDAAINASIDALVNPNISGFCDIKARTTSYSSTEEGDGGEDEANGGDEDECKGQGEEEY